MMKIYFKNQNSKINTKKIKKMKKYIEIRRALAGYTRISYKGEEIAKHYLSATTQGTREAFEIPEEESVISWLENNFADEIKAITEEINND